MMELCLYTDSVPDLFLDEALDLTVTIGARAVEIAAGGPSRRPFLEALADVGYDDALSIENEDRLEPAVDRRANAARFIHPAAAHRVLKLRLRTQHRSAGVVEVDLDPLTMCSAVPAKRSAD